MIKNRIHPTSDPHNAALHGLSLSGNDHASRNGHGGGKHEQVFRPEQACQLCRHRPSVRSSGGKTFHSRVRPKENRYLKWTFIKAADRIVLFYKRGASCHEVTLYVRVREKRGTPSLSLGWLDILPKRPIGSRKMDNSIKRVIPTALFRLPGSKRDSPHAT